jgi:3-ketosteroid 9alpha-monooxygenase subunit B
VPGAPVTAIVEVTLDGQASRLAWPPGARLLDVLIEAGLDPPYSCREGKCGTCTCELIRGEVAMAANEVLEAEDLADGYILACQATPLTPEICISYD